MTNLKTYTRLLETQENLNEQQKAFDKEKEYHILRRLHNLHTVGRSVAAKCYGRTRFHTFTMDELSNNLNWLALPNYTVKELTATQIIIHSEKAASRHPGGLIKLPVSLLQLSDRDLAKQVRTSIRERKERIRRVEVRTAKEVIDKTEQEIVKHQKEIARLNRLVAAAAARQKVEKERKEEVERQKAEKARLKEERAREYQQARQLADATS